MFAKINQTIYCPLFRGAVGGIIFTAVCQPAVCTNITNKSLVNEEGTELLTKRDKEYSSPDFTGRGLII